MSTIKIIRADTAERLEMAKNLFEEYAGTLNFDLGYQDFQKELQTIDQQYQPPRGNLLLCFTNEGVAAGCAGIRRFSEHIAELKRLYVKPAYRSLKLGRSLLESAIETARALGYQFIRLDTVPGQEKAHQLYRYLGFYEIAPYRYSPIEGTIYFEKDLAPTQVSSDKSLA